MYFVKNIIFLVVWLFFVFSCGSGEIDWQALDEYEDQLGLWCPSEGEQCNDDEYAPNHWVKMILGRGNEMTPLTEDKNQKVRFLDFDDNGEATIIGKSVICRPDYFVVRVTDEGRRMNPRVKLLLTPPDDFPLNYVLNLFWQCDGVENYNPLENNPFLIGVLEDMECTIGDSDDNISSLGVSCSNVSNQKNISLTANLGCRGVSKDKGLLRIKVSPHSSSDPAESYFDIF